MTDKTVTVLPDGSAFAIASFPLPKDHWLYAEREYAPGADEPKELPAPILTHTERDTVVAAVRYAVRGATMCGKEQDFDPDALVQNAVYALCGPFTAAIQPAPSEATGKPALQVGASEADPVIRNPLITADEAGAVPVAYLIRGKQKHDEIERDERQARLAKEFRDKAYDGEDETEIVPLYAPDSAPYVAWFIDDKELGKEYITRNPKLAKHLIEEGAVVRPLVYGNAAPPSARAAQPEKWVLDMAAELGLNQHAQPEKQAMPVGYIWRRHGRDDWHYAAWIPISDEETAEMRREGWEVKILTEAAPPAPSQQSPQTRLETTSEHIARDIREGRFPNRSEPQRVQSTEWGPMPDAGTESDFSQAPVAHVAGNDVSRYLEWDKNRSAWERPIGTPVYYAAPSQQAAPAVRSAEAKVNDLRTFLDEAKNAGITHLPDDFPEKLAAATADSQGEDGLTSKQSWWAGYRAGKGLPADTPRQVAINSARIVTHWPDGTPRDQRDIASDPEGKLIHDPSEPLKAADAQGDDHQRCPECGCNYPLHDVDCKTGRARAAQGDERAAKHARLPPFPDELYEHYVSMSAQTHKAHVQDYARAALSRQPSAPASAEVIRALRELVSLEADGMHASEASIEPWERARAALAAAKPEGGE